MRLRVIGDLGDLAGRRVLTRVDFNVPMIGARIADDARIRLTIPTIEALVAAGAMPILLAHLKEGKYRETLAPVADHLKKMVPGTIFFRERIGTRSLTQRLASVPRGSVALLENIRRYAGETANDRAFAKSLAALGDVFVNDAFAVCHRDHASVATTPTLLPSAAGLLLEREVAVLSKILEDPAAPFVALLGGAKISTKVPVIERLVGIADTVLIGGALVNHFFSARGYDVGVSLLEAEGVAAAKRLLRNRARHNLTLPIDVVIGRADGTRSDARVVPIRATKHVICEWPFAILDIGPETIRAYSEQLKAAATIVWNGPMGMFERPPFHHGSVTLARVIASRSSGRAFGVVGGGETLAILAQTKMARYIDHVSSGGGAMLAFLGGEQLSGLTPLVKS